MLGQNDFNLIYIFASFIGVLQKPDKRFKLYLTHEY